MKRLVLIFLLGVSAAVFAANRSVEYADLTNKGTIKVEYVCQDFSLPRVYECSSQRITAKYPAGAFTFEVNVPRGPDKLQSFWVSNIAVATITSSDNDLVIIVNYLDTSGSASAAEERYEVLEFNAGGKLTSSFGLMTYKAYEEWAAASGLKMAKMKATGALV